MEITYRVWLRLVLFLSVLNKSHTKVVASGNAMELAQMNMNMMRNGCPLLPCQSACTVRNVDTGCYECTAGCGSGAVVGNPGIQNPMQSQNNGQFYGCIPNWIGCPSHCTAIPDQRGCVQCRCTSTGTSSTTVPKGLSVFSSLSPLNNTTPHKSTQIAISMKGPSQGTHTYTTQSNYGLPKSNIVSHQEEKSTIRTKIHQHKAKWKHSWGKHEKVKEDKTESLSNPSILSTISDKNVTFHKEDMNASSFSKHLIIPFASVAGIFFISSTVFFVLWRRSTKILHKQLDELYFVKKAHRQDSQSRLTTQDMLDPVYAHVQSTPEPPPRGPTTVSLIPRAPSSEGCTKTVSFSSQTTVKKEFCDTYSLNHDYLELI